MVNGLDSKPITEAVKALSGTPVLLVLVLLNVLILGMITYLLKVRAEGIREERIEIMKMLKDCLDETPQHMSSTGWCIDKLSQMTDR